MATLQRWIRSFTLCNIAKPFSAYALHAWVLCRLVYGLTVHSAALPLWILNSMCVQHTVPLVQYSSFLCTNASGSWQVLATQKRINMRKKITVHSRQSARGKHDSSWWTNQRIQPTMQKAAFQQTCSAKGVEEKQSKSESKRRSFKKLRTHAAQR